ncbi:MULTISPECIES: hypothetical protein [unclassified Thermoactinomyces]|jgi:hypothetical protein|uniref:hypothetical protein n=1 Tax=unclassified Thermoactinomyces TaxID=2634588 RepID=UPI0018DB1073|nr:MULTISPECIES: hypothetical protein [unclassified Thermoactinomyces]MBH8599280.1 hypothetical protein [Thermoactinomyces sp. CICC 10523]MBH8605834.1 hypothetical protein [Thermoactinomyces sp. CICC 10522]MBH8608821.1 hypothetical protein [Thermoactinomyces sp. CICC 10521]
MFKPYNDRKVEIGQKVDVYKNLRNGLWSIRDHSTGLILGHADQLVLENTEFKISESGKRKAIQNGRRNVHAYVVGTLISFDVKDYVLPDRLVGYHFIYTKTFIDKKTNEPIYTAKLVCFTKEAVFA